MAKLLTKKTATKMEKKIDTFGYVWILAPNHPGSHNGYVKRSRLNVEMRIGRFLTSKEVVHHLDENKGNDSISNLMIFPSQKEHASFHNKVRQLGFTRPIKKQIEERFKNYG